MLTKKIKPSHIRRHDIKPIDRKLRIITESPIKKSNDFYKNTVKKKLKKNAIY